MSIITLKNKESNRPNITSLIEQYKEIEKKKSRYSNTLGFTKDEIREYFSFYGYNPSDEELEEIMENSDSSYDYDYNDIIYDYDDNPSNNKKLYKDKKSKKVKDKKSNKRYCDTSHIADSCIRLYPDIHDLSTFRKLENYYELDEYCTDNDIDIEPSVMSYIMNNDSFCCCPVLENPYSNRKKLLVDSNACDLRWQAAVYNSNSYSE